MSKSCFHHNHSTSKEFIQHSDDIFVCPQTVSNFQFDGLLSSGKDFMGYLKWIEKLNQNKALCTICYGCIIAFWSNRSICGQFLKHSSHIAASEIAEYLNFIFLSWEISFQQPSMINIKQQDLVIKEKVERLYTLVEIVDLWHQFLLYPQFIKYYLIKNMKLFKTFLKFWYCLLQILYNFHTPKSDFDKLDKKNNFINSRIQYQQYLTDKLMYISRIFYAFIRYLKKKHLKNKYFGKYVYAIKIKVDSRNFCDVAPLENILHLILKQLSCQFKKYNIDNKCIHSLNVKDATLTQLSHDIQQKMMNADKIKCGNFQYCRKTFKLHKNMKLCSQCKITYYCDRKCQKLHWKYAHRLNCSKTTPNHINSNNSHSNNTLGKGNCIKCNCGVMVCRGELNQYKSVSFGEYGEFYEVEEEFPCSTANDCLWSSILGLCFMKKNCHSCKNTIGFHVVAASSSDKLKYIKKVLYLKSTVELLTVR